MHKGELLQGTSLHRPPLLIRCCDRAYILGVGVGVGGVGGAHSQMINA